MRSLAVSIVVVLFFATSAFSQDQWHWKWSEGKSSVFHYFVNSPSAYKTSLVRSGAGRFGPITIQISKSGELLFELKGHEKSVFVIKDDTLVYADYSEYSTGCKLIAIDLSRKKKQWEKRLKGIGRVSHSEYTNRINMEIRKNDVVVYGNELSGQYIEVVRIDDGKEKFHAVGQHQNHRFVKPESDTSPRAAKRQNVDAGYFVVECTVIDSRTKEKSANWTVNVNHSWIGSGPVRHDHFCMPCDVNGRFYICVAPTVSDADKYPERLGIELTSHSKSKTTFLVSRDMWKSGEWKTPKLVRSGKNKEENAPKIELKLRLVSPSKTLVGPSD